jgi:hypothetical protein
MPDFLKPLAGDVVSVDPWTILWRLVLALVFGSLVAWVYQRTMSGGAQARALPTTLVLLAVLIAMVTQVIGDNVARAFSLVGALSIVRFRTVVRDTRDTAFVIFAVVVGMAVGSSNLWVAILGLLVGGAAAFAMAGRLDAEDEVYLLRIRAGLAVDLEELLAQQLKNSTQERRLLSVATARQGGACEATYQVRLQPGFSAERVVKALHGVDGIQDVRLLQRDFEQA